MSTLISSSSDTLLAPLHTQTSGPVVLNEPGSGAAHAVAKPATPSQDVVTLSVSAQIQQLVQQGQSASEIANTLGLTASLVNSYLYVPLSTAAPDITAQSSASNVTFR